MAEARRTIEVAGTRVSACEYATAPSRNARLVLSHGAGAGHDHPFLVDVARRLAARGVTVATFNFPYREAGRGAPDRPEVLERALADALATLGGSAGETLFAGGKSMGGRIASQVVARTPGDVRGLVFLGYPLHPPKKPEKLRTAHLLRVPVPMLFVQGERDAFGTPDELRPHLEGLAAGTRVHVVPGGDHSFRVAKKAPDSLPEMIDAVVGWMDAVLNAPPGRPA